VFISENTTQGDARDFDEDDAQEIQLGIEYKRVQDRNNRRRKRQEKVSSTSFSVYLHKAQKIRHTHGMSFFYCTTEPWCCLLISSDLQNIYQTFWLHWKKN
jgi:hypothetical protein